MNAPKLNVTRSKVECPIFGSPIDLNYLALLTIEEMLRCYLFIRYEIKYNKQCGKEPSFVEVCNELVPKIANIWKTASIPTVSRDRIVQLIRKYHDKYLSLIRHPKSKRNMQYELKVNSFKIDYWKDYLTLLHVNANFLHVNVKNQGKCRFKNKNFFWIKGRLEK